MSTVFSKIIAGELPCFKVYEDDVVLAFLDIRPVQPGHTLVVPKKEFIGPTETDTDVLLHIMKIGQDIARAQKELLNCDGVKFVMNDGKAAGQDVFHTHLHIIPRYQDDGVYPSPLSCEYEEGEAEEVAARLSNSINL